MFAVSFKLSVVFILARERPPPLKMVKEERLPKKLQKHRAKLWGLW